MVIIAKGWFTILNTANINIEPYTIYSMYTGVYVPPMAVKYCYIVTPMIRENSVPIS